MNRGIDLLQQELFHQILDDGGPAEQSLNYHRFVLDLYWLAVDFMEKNASRLLSLEITTSLGRNVSPGLYF